jgi:hypothetical protein
VCQSGGVCEIKDALTLFFLPVIFGTANWEHRAMVVAAGMGGTTGRSTEYPDPRVSGFDRLCIAAL